MSLRNLLAGPFAALTLRWPPRPRRRNTPSSWSILYGDNNNWFAAWGAWVFDIYGIRT